MRTLIVVIFAFLLPVWAEDTAARLYRNARKAYEKKDFIAAYLLSSEAVARDPKNSEYWEFARSVRTRAMPGLKVESTPAPSAAASSISAADLREARQAQPPPMLRGRDELHDFNTRGDTRQLYEEVCRAYGLSVLFDRDLLPGASAPFRVEQMRWQDALHALETLTGTFIVPVNERVALIAKDNAQKRAELEPVMNVLVDYPQPLTPQEIQEAARAVQTTFDITKMGIDNALRVVLFRDRVSRLRPAVELFRQLTEHRGQMVAEVDLLLVSSTSSLAYGLGLQNASQLVFTGQLLSSLATTYTAPSGYATPLPSFGGGRTSMAIGIADTELLATMTRGQAQSLASAQLLCVDGQAAQFHVGDRYPIITAKYSNSTTNTSAYATAPSVQFEDLGLSLKITSRVHSSTEVSLEIEAEVKSLGSETVNDIPVVSNRKLATRIRTGFDETVILAGIGQSTLAQSWSGLPLVSFLPGARDNSHSLDRAQLLITVRPRLVSPPPGESPGPAIRVGSESRTLTPLD